MDVKVYCPCGAKFLFEIEPVGGRMPAPVKCPVCAADATELANKIIAEKLASVTPLAAPAPAPSASPKISIPASPIKVGPATPSVSPPKPVAPAEAKPVVAIPGAGAPMKVMPPPAGAPSRISVSGGHTKPAEPAASATSAPPAAPPAAEPAVQAPAPVTSTASPSIPNPSAITPPAGGVARVSVSGGGHSRPPVPEVPQTSTASAVPIDPGVATCPKHVKEFAVAECFVCHKPICAKCMEDFGYLCSSYCKGQAEARKLDVPVYAGSRYQKFKSESKDQSRILTAVAALAALLIGGYIYYWFVLSKPKQQFKVETGPGTPFMYADWLGPDRFFTVTPARAVMFTADKGEEVWGFDLPKEIKGFKNKKDEWYFDFEPRVKVVSKDIWIALPQRVIRLDGATGKKKQEIAMGRTVDDYHVGEAHFLAVSGNQTNDSKTLTRINLQNGAVESVATPATTGTRQIVGVTRAMPGLQNTSLKNFTEDDEEFGEFHSTSYGRDRDYVFTGANVAHITRDLAERRIGVQAADKPKGNLMIDNQGLRASQGLAAASEFIKSQEDDTKYDESLYTVKIRRYFGGGAEWNGQIAGRPYLFTQKTVDILAGAKAIIVFDKNNRKLWEAKLTYPINPLYGSSDDEQGPTLEQGGRLLFHDQGVLTAFDLKKGDVQWRVNAVGITTLATDSEGNLYISGTTSGPEDIKANGIIHNADRAHPQLFKVELKTGKVIWQMPRVGSNAITSGQYVYTQFGKFSGIDMMSEAMGGSEAQIHWRLFRIDPGSGKDKWEYYRLGAPESVRPNEKRILLHYKDSLRMLKFM